MSLSKRQRRVILILDQSITLTFHSIKRAKKETIEFLSTRERILKFSIRLSLLLIDSSSKDVLQISKMMNETSTERVKSISKLTCNFKLQKRSKFCTFCLFSFHLILLLNIRKAVHTLASIETEHRYLWFASCICLSNLLQHYYVCIEESFL